MVAGVVPSSSVVWLAYKQIRMNLDRFLHLWWKSYGGQVQYCTILHFLLTVPSTALAQRDFLCTWKSTFQPGSPGSFPRTDTLEKVSSHIVIYKSTMAKPCIWRIHNLNTAALEAYNVFICNIVTSYDPFISLYRYSSGPVPTTMVTSQCPPRHRLRPWLWPPAALPSWHPRPRTDGLCVRVGPELFQL